MYAQLAPPPSQASSMLSFDDSNFWAFEWHDSDDEPWDLDAEELIEEWRSMLPPDYEPSWAFLSHEDLAAMELLVLCD